MYVQIRYKLVQLITFYNYYQVTILVVQFSHSIFWVRSPFYRFLVMENSKNGKKKYGAKKLAQCKTITCSPPEEKVTVTELIDNYKLMISIGSLFCASNVYIVTSNILID